MKKLLIVEDDQIVANIYRNKFSAEGFQVEIARDGEAGLELVRSFRPDAVLLDLMLPRMTGVDLLRQVRSEAGCEKLPVIVLSNTYLTNMVQQAWKAGATKCLSKASCTPKQVVEAVRSAVGVSGATPAAPPAPAAGPGTAPRPSSPAAAPAESAAAPARDPDAEFQADLRKSFLQELPALLAELRSLVQGLIKAQNEALRLQHIQGLCRRVHALTGNAGIAGVLPIARMSDALEALLKELHDKPQHLNASTLRTVASAVDALGDLFQHRVAPGNQDLSQANVLVVDDEAISRRAIVYALDKAKLKSVHVEDPAVGYDLLLQDRFDLIFLDVDMPGMSGFELCSKLRSLPTYKKTPVVFVTALDDFENKANSTMSGGNDFIGKPFLFIELAVKALVYVLRGRLQEAR